MDAHTGPSPADEDHYSLGRQSDPPESAPRPGPDPGNESDPAVRRLVSAVDDLTDLSSQPVDGHADRYRDVHTVLQDALSDTDRGGPQPT